MSRPIPIILAALLTVAPAAAEEGVLSAPEAQALAGRGRAILIDIRRPDEWRATGIPAGAKRADASQKDGPSGFLHDVLEIVGDRRDVTLVPICRTGNRTARARAFLLSKGFAEVYHVKEGVGGGILQPRVRGQLPLNPPCSPFSKGGDLPCGSSTTVIDRVFDESVHISAFQIPSD